MKRRFQFSLRVLLNITLMAACFFAGMRFERQLRRIEEEKSKKAIMQAINSQTSRVIHARTILEPSDRTSRLLQGTEMRSAALELRGFSDVAPRNSQ